MLPCTCGWSPLDRHGVTDYLSSRDRQSAETAAYIETYDLLAEHNLSDPTLSSRYVENLARRFISRLDLAGKDFCDVGSGRGYAVKYAFEQGPKSVSALDIAAPSLRDVASRYPVEAYLANAENLPFERHFDVIAATDIVEHVPNVANFLVTANWALRDDGVLAVRVPYREIMLWYSNFYGLPMHFTHLRTFDRTLLLDLLGSAGFRVWSVHYDGFLHYRSRAWLARIPGLKAAVERGLLRHYGHADDVTNISAALGRLLMRPVEISAIAKKVEHLGAHDIYSKLGPFVRSRRIAKGKSEHPRAGGATLR